MPNFRPRPWIHAALALGALGAVAAACNDESTSPADGQHRVYGAAQAVGNGTARTYVLTDGDATPLEVGVVLDEKALEGLQAPMQMPASTDPHAHVDTHPYDLAMPAQNPTPYKLVELDWNPGGHEPPGIYDIPHFDFHFYTITKAERDAIDPAALGEAQYVAKSVAMPPAEQRAPGYVPLAAPGTAPVAVPHMGVHWSDLSAPELQGALGHPEAFKPFTTTFIHGAWDGKFIFDEPMVTRAFILGRKSATTAAQRDSLVLLQTPTRTTAGLTPGAYRVTYDADAKEYRIALTQFVKK
ncbi:hypothetical protein J421_4766 (plasmid) [Gemmatirosa kalamazoonensis]|uniref:TTHB210-like domain-containing protein n=1 Tax=Gemmatirosa kalamazoonensis TaxID=861299 RepID=W0RNI5_9BACT|nr:DUF5602 domain-containing protein [Gemmatirosa kalamazoonensis]AHG92301.1 hypothetical protein J421_4766 [Gemmatirosa kalamazoonensis]